MTEDLKTKKALILETARGDQGTAMERRRDRSVAPAARSGAWRGRQNGNGIHCGRAERCGQKVTINQQEEPKNNTRKNSTICCTSRRGRCEVSIMRLDELMRKFRSQANTPP